MFKGFFKNFKLPTSNEIGEILLLVPVFSLYATINKYVVSFIETEGQSMQPTIEHGSITLIDRFFYKNFRGLQKGDVIVATSPIDPKTQICKRIAYLPGEVKEVDNGFYKEYLKVPENHVWIEGDNKRNSFDSRHHGPLPIELVQGRVIYLLFPFKQVDDLNNGEPLTEQ